MDVHFRAPRELLVESGQIDCHAADLTATVAADLPLASAQAELAKFDQWISIDGDPNIPVGRLVEENSTGPLRLGYGGWRDLLLGCQFRLPDGRLITAGGRTMKNVAGYDLTKFMVGQRGMFASLANFTVRTYKRPAAALLAVFKPSDTWLGEILATPLRPRYAILTNDCLRCGWLDEPAAISLFERLAADEHPRKLLRRTLEEDIRDRGRLWRQDGEYFRASVPPTRILGFAGAAGVRDWIADAAFGVVIGRYDEIEIAAIEKGAELCGGSVAFFAPGKPPRWARNDAEATVICAIRNAFVSAG